MPEAITDESSDSVADESDDTSSEIPTVNGHPLNSLENAEEAFDYLDDDYNDGSINRNLTGERLIVTSRAASFAHMSDVLDAHRRGLIDVKNVFSRSGKTCVEIEESSIETDTEVAIA